jgi:PmbA protein
LTSARATGVGIREATQGVVELARRLGAEQCDAFAVAYDESSVAVRLGAVEKLIEAGSRSLGLRVISGGRTAVCSTSDLSEDSLAALTRDTVELARISEPDEHAGLPDESLFARSMGEGMQLYDERLEAMTTEEKMGLALACEGAGLGFDPRITNSSGATLATRMGEVALANSLGFSGGYPSTSVSLQVEVMADDVEGKKRNAYWYSSERSLHRLMSPEEIGRIAARRALDQLGARKVASKKVPVVFEPRMAAALIRGLVECLTGAALYRKATFLAASLGETVGSPLFTLTDDPTEAARAGSRPFDGEGVGARPTVLFDRGRFEGFLFDSYTARRTGNSTTGSAQRGVETLPSPGASNLSVMAGLTPPDEIVAGVADGLYVTSLMGQGFNPTTGDFSRGCGGFWIERGRVAFPVTEINVSANMRDMLAGIDAVGSDVSWFGATAAPTLRIRSMTVSGL